MHDKIRRLPSLGALRVFEVAARHQNLLRAAEELHVTHGAVSKQVQALEAELEEPLFERRNRGVFLTEQGRWLSSKLSDMFGELETTIQDFRKHARPRPLIISCEPTLCLKLMIPSFADLKGETGLDVRYLAAGGPIDFRRDHVDLAIRRNDFTIETDLAVADLAEEWMGPVGLPSVMESPDLIDQAALLHSATRPRGWQDWQKRRARTSRISEVAVTYEHFYLAIQAAEAGQGLALASVHMVARDLALGRLCAPYGFVKDGTHYVAISSTAFSLDPRKEVFIRWLRTRMQKNEIIATLQPNI